jgi:hypothetical protein
MNEIATPFGPHTPIPQTSAKLLLKIQGKAHGWEINAETPLLNAQIGEGEWLQANC